MPRWRALAAGLVRGSTKRCPRCGAGALFRRWFSMVERCPRCGIPFEREAGFVTGAMALNIVVTETVYGLFLVNALALTVPDVPVAALVLAGVAINVVVPVLYYPFSKTTWAAVELAMRPLEPAEEADAITWLATRTTADEG